MHVLYLDSHFKRTQAQKRGSVEALTLTMYYHRIQKICVDFCQTSTCRKRMLHFSSPLSALRSYVVRSLYDYLSMTHSFVILKTAFVTAGNDPCNWLSRRLKRFIFLLVSLPKSRIRLFAELFWARVRLGEDVHRKAQNER